MVDYRDKPTTSPLVWCHQCTKLVPVEPSTMVMKTAYKMDSRGLFPYGLCTLHQPTAMRCQ